MIAPSVLRSYLALEPFVDGHDGSVDGRHGADVGTHAVFGVCLVLMTAPR